MLDILIHCVNPHKDSWTNAYFELCNNISFFKNEAIVSVTTQRKALHIIETVGHKQVEKINHLMNNPKGHTL